jgi:hypothetical protein
MSDSDKTTHKSSTRLRLYISQVRSDNSVVTPKRVITNTYQNIHKQGCTNFLKSLSHVERQQKCDFKDFGIEEPQILGPSVQNLVPEQRGVRGLYTPVKIL